MNKTESIISDISEIIEKTNFNREFNDIKKYGDAQKIFLWVERKLRNGDLPHELKPLLTDLYFMIH